MSETNNDNKYFLVKIENSIFENEPKLNLNENSLSR